MADYRIFEVKKAIAKHYQERHPNIGIKMEHITSGVYETKSLTEFAAGRPPEVMDRGSIVSPFLKKGVLLNLQRYSCFCYYGALLQ